MTKKRRLGDLYVVGREVTVDDGDGPVTVWVQKLNPLETEQAMRRAGVAKAKVLMSRRDKQSEEYLDIYAEVSEMKRDALVDLAIGEQVSQALESADAEIGAQDEWANEGYLQGLRDAWAEKLYDVHAGGDEDSPDWEEAEKVYAELQRFDATLTKRLEGERARLEKDHDDVPLDELVEIGVDRVISFRADTMWLREWRRAQIWLGTREAEDHKKRYFDKREEVDQLPIPVLSALQNAYETLEVALSEGKDLPPTPSSSQQSALQDEGETAASSGLTVVAP